MTTKLLLLLFQMKERTVNTPVPNTVVQKLERLLKDREQKRKREEKKDQVQTIFYPSYVTVKTLRTNFLHSLQSPVGDLLTPAPNPDTNISCQKIF